MNNEYIIAPSLLSADFSKVGVQLSELKRNGSQWIHLDVMDGLFVPNISIGITVISSLRKSSDMFFDTHLMIASPERYIAQFAKAGSDLITFHVEATDNPGHVLDLIHEHQKKAGISIKPGTPVSSIAPFLSSCDLVLVMTVEPGFGGQKFMPDMIPKIGELVRLRNELNLSYDIEVDGGINQDTAKLCRDAGANVFVAGNSVLGQANVGEAFQKITASLRYD